MKQKTFVTEEPDYRGGKRGWGEERKGREGKGEGKGERERGQLDKEGPGLGFLSIRQGEERER